MRPDHSAPLGYATVEYATLMRTLPQHCNRLKNEWQNDAGQNHCRGLIAKPTVAALFPGLTKSEI